MMRTTAYRGTGHIASGDELWPPLPYNAWKETLYTLHRCLQVIGKVKLERAPFINEWWEVAFYVTSRGMTTGLIPFGGYRAFQVDMDFIDHTLHISASNNQHVDLPFAPRSVARFYDDFMGALDALELTTAINTMPVEVPQPIAFDKDTQLRPYDRSYVTRWWQITLQSAIIFDRFRTAFGGKSSPIQFFWGSFDLAGTRFSGKKATPPKEAGVMDRIMRFAEDQENFSFGFWPGDATYQYPAYYAYIYPAPSSLNSITLNNGAAFNTQLSEFILPYRAVRTADSPNRVVFDFLNDTYMQSAKLAGWNLEQLKANIPPDLRRLSSE